MINTILIYTWTITIVCLWLLFSVMIILLTLYLFWEILKSRVILYFLMTYPFKKMTEEQRWKLQDLFYDIKGNNK